MLHYRRLAAGAIIAAIAIAAAACGSSATTAPTSAPASVPAAATEAPATPAPATPPPAETAAPESAAPEQSTAPGESLALPSIDLGGFLQHQNPDLEAKLPDTLNGATLTKSSYKGLSSLGATGGTDPFAGALGSLGASADNLSFAVAFDLTGGTEAGYLAYQIPGMDASQFLNLMKGAVGQGDPSTKVSDGNVGGKNVTLVTGSSGTVYLYTSGDILYGVFAPDDATAATALQALP